MCRYYRLDSQNKKSNSNVWSPISWQKSCFQEYKNTLDYQFELTLLKFNIEHLDRNSLPKELSKVLEGQILIQNSFHQKMNDLMGQNVCNERFLVVGDVDVVAGNHCENHFLFTIRILAHN